MPDIISVELDPRPEWRQPHRPAKTKKKLPTMYDLPSENPEEPGLPDMFHDIQAQLLKETFCPPDYPSDHQRPFPVFRPGPSVVVQTT